MLRRWLGPALSRPARLRAQSLKFPWLGDCIRTSTCSESSSVPLTVVPSSEGGDAAVPSTTATTAKGAVPPPFLVPPREVPPPRLSPARQNPFSPVLTREDAKVLLAKASYAIFTLAYSAEEKKYAIYAATTNEVVVADEASLWRVSMWMDERITDDFIAGLVFGSDTSAPVKTAVETITHKTMKRTVVAPDTWGITYLAFRAQQEAVQGADLPQSLEHASFLLSQKQFDAGRVDPTMWEVTNNSKSQLTDKALLQRVGAIRSALLSWDVLLDVHRRFGTPGSRKTLNPIDQIVRRVVKAVNVFIVDLDVRVGKGTIADGHTMIATIYDAQRRTQSVHYIRSLAEETAKLNTLTTLLYGEGSSSISLFVPTRRTRASQLVAFARTCRPKSPFFVTELTSLGPYLGAVQLPLANGSVQEDPRGTWAMIRNSYATDKQVKRDEEKLNQLLLRGFTALANKLFSDRLQKVAPAIISAVNSIPSQELDLASYTRVEGLVEEARRNPVPHLTASTFLNKVNVNDAEVVFGLQQWRSKIYENADRRQREQQAMEGLRRYLVIDLETTTARRYKRIANPFTKENFVVLSGARDHKGRVFMPKRYFDRSVAIRYDDPNLCAATYLVEKSSKLSLFLPPLDDYDVLVGHNIKFDLLHLWRDAELRRFLARGGKVWDTMYAEYLLTGQDVKLGSGAGLEDVAKSYGGQTPKLDAVKRAWAEGKDTYEIPYATLTEYLHGDLENTELIFRKHMERAFNQRQVIICNARMDSLLCTTEMEYNGLKTNVDLALTQSSKLVKQVADLRARLISCIPTELPADCHKFFNWSSNQHLIAFFFGGKLKLSTHARSSKILPGETFSRHTLYLPTSAYPPTAFPNGVFLRPPVHVMGVCDCAILAGTSMAKGTRIFKAYFEAYMRQGNFRKSSTLLESLRQEMVAIPRSTPERRGESSALANLLPRRHLFLFAALSSTATGGIAKLFVKNAITGESITITEDQKGAKLRGFIAGQVRAHTAMLLPVDGDVSEENAAFAEAQVTILVRDAAFSWLRSWNTDESLVAYLQEHTGAGVGGGGSDGARPTQGVDPVDRYSISFADTVATLAYFKHQYSDAGAKRTSAEAVIPAKVLPPAKRSKGATAEVWCKMLRQEANMKPEEWCNYYIDLCLHMANAALQKEGEQSGETPRASTSKKPTKLKKKQAAAAPDDDDLPIMLRQRRAFVGFYNSLPENDRKRLSLMNMVGKTVGSVYDCYAQACSHDDVVEVDLKGKLATYIQNELEADQVMRRFRSSSTRQLQVGEDTLKYFKKTHKDDTAAVILELRGMEKLIGTYYESTDGGTGMVSLVHSVDSCIHHELIHNKTNTGRLASANPNCQNIPKEDKSQLRDMFISRFSEQGMCIESDYSQLEVVALAVLSSDDQMLEDLRQNVDFHCKRVTMMRPDLKYTDVLFRAKKNKEPEFVKLRQQAKIFSFQRQYGAGAKMISQSTGLTQDQVRMLIEKERETYRGVDVFNNIVTLSANNYDASLQDGSRNVRGHQFFKGMFPVLTGSRYIFTESDVPEGMINHRDAARKSTNFSPTHLKNYPVQGFAGEVVQIILGRLWRHFQAKNNYNELAFLTNTVHDCVWVDCHVSVYREVAKDVESIMNSARAVLNELFPEMNVTVEFPCDIVAGDSMGTLRPIVEEASY